MRDRLGRFIKKDKRDIDLPYYWNWYGAKRRCTDKRKSSYKNYGGRGIKFNISLKEVGVLYKRDAAELMDKPSIDRIDNDGDYIFDNCRFIESSENVRRSNLGRKVSEETKIKTSKALKGKPKTKEHNRNVSIALKKWWKKRKEQK